MSNTNYEATYNICKNWGLRCYEQKVTEKAVVLKCSMNKKNKTTGEYSTPVYIDVVCGFDTCDIAEGDYTKTLINVDGQFSVSDYTAKDGNKRASMTIFANKVTAKS